MENKSYYAVIPATVRYDERLKLLSRMLYGEITALCNDKGYCWASNSYFAELYGMSIKSISRAVSELKDCGYINVELQFKENKEVDKRIIRISNPMDKIVATYGQNCPEGMDKNVQENNTLNNTINSRKKKKEFTPPTLEEVEAYCKERKNNVDAKRFIDYYSVDDWKDKNGKPVRNWKQKMISVWEKDDNKNNYQSNPIPQQPTNPYKSYAEILKEEEEMLKRIKGISKC